MQNRYEFNIGILINNRLKKVPFIDIQRDKRGVRYIAAMLPTSLTLSEEEENHLMDFIGNHATATQEFDLHQDEDGHFSIRMTCVDDINVIRSQNYYI